MQQFSYIAAVFVLGGIASAAVIAVDLRTCRQTMPVMRSVWILTGLWASFFGLLAYFAFGRTRRCLLDEKTETDRGTEASARPDGHPGPSAAGTHAAVHPADTRGPASIPGMARPGASDPDTERAGMDRKGMAMSGMDKAVSSMPVPETEGMERNGSARPETETAGMDRPAGSMTGTEITGAKTAGMKPETMHDTQAGRDAAGTSIRGTEMPGMDQTMHGSHTAGMEMPGISMNGTERGGIDMSGKSMPGTETHGTERAGMNRSGTEMSGMSMSGMDMSGMDMPPRPKWQSVVLSTLHCGAGCTLADLLGEWFLYFVPIAIGGSLIAGAWVLDYILALIFGIGFQYAAIRAMEPRTPHAQIVRRAAKADILSLTAWQAGMYGWMAVVIFALRGGVPLPRTSFAFWFMMQIAMACGFLLALPVNVLLIRAGIKKGM